jgi:hypothetical protein
MVGDRVPVCPVDIEHVVMRSDRFDAYACLQCNVWLRPLSPCSDPDCCYCKDRPEKPCERDN